MQYRIIPETGVSDFYFCELYHNDYTEIAHIHSHMEFVYVLRGDCTISTADGDYNITEGQVFSLMPYSPHGIITPEGSEVFLIACPPDYVAEYRQILIGNHFDPPSAKFGNSVKTLIEDIIESGYKEDFKKKALLYCTLSEFLSQSTICSASSEEFDLYRRVMAYISEHFREDITLNSVAHYACVSPAHLSRVINHSSDLSFCDIVNSLRVYYAKELMEQKDISISDVAYESGFGSIRNFNRIFKTHFGITPREYQKR